MDQAREIGRTIKAAGVVLGWVREADEDAAAALAMAPPVRGLLGAQRALDRASVRLVQVDRDRAIEEVDIALRASLRPSGDASLVASLVHAALERALSGFGAPAAMRAAANRVQLVRAVAG